MQKTILFIILIVITFSFTFLASAQTKKPSNGGGSGESPPVSLDNPIGGGKEPVDMNKLIGTIINAVLGVVGSLSLLMFIYGGLVWMTAAGSKEKIQKGKDVLVWSIIGLVVIFMSYAIVTFVLNDLIKAAGTK